MSKYFIDCEFIEGFHKPLFGKRRHFIDLISIGIYCEDGRSYYAISNEFNEKDADDWVLKNVIYPLPLKNFNGSNIDEVKLWKANKQIAEEIFQFCTNDSLTIEKAIYYNVVNEGIEFYAYYADYDWVVFCSLFGRMIDLPKGFPMWCIDLKQTLDEKEFKMKLPDGTIGGHKSIKDFGNYPKQENEHNALADAKWNYELYKFLQSI